MHRRSLLGAAAACALAPAARAQAPWPARPVRLVVPFPAGGTSDAMGRMVAEALGRELGQPFVVDNAAGAGGTIGTLRTAQSAPDGYTLLLSGVGQNAIAHGLNRALGYDSMQDFVHIGQIHSGPNVLVAHASAPFASFGAFVDYVRRNPGRLSYAYTLAASGHMAMELLKLRAAQCTGGDCKGFFLVGISYRGGGPMMADLLDGQVPLMFINQDLALPHVRDGKLRALAVTSLQRNPLYPQVPTVAESGFPGFQALSWSGLSALRGTPQPVVDRLEAALRKVMASAEVRHRLEAAGFTVPPPGRAAYTRFVQSEIALWTRVIRAAGIKAG